MDERDVARECPACRGSWPPAGHRITELGRTVALRERIARIRAHLAA